MLCSSLLPAGEAEHLQTAPGTAEHSLHPSRVWQNQTPPLGYTVRAALGGSPAATSLGNPGLEIGRNGAATPIGKGSVPKTVVVCFLGVELRGGLVFPLLWKLS